jgi:hypothetical protein
LVSKSLPVFAYGYDVVIRLGWGDITPKHACNLRIHPRASPWFSAKADKKITPFFAGLDFQPSNRYDWFFTG